MYEIIKQSLWVLMIVSTIIITSTVAFAPLAIQIAHSHDDRQHSSNTRVFGLTEWRNTEQALRPVPILPREAHHVLLQGQTAYMQFTTDEEMRVFQQALDRHGGMFGMGLFSGNCQDHDVDDDDENSSVLLDTMPLLEIQDYNMMGGRFGIFCKAKVVGRARVHDVLNEDGKGSITAVCMESYDKFEDSPDFESANEIAGIVESIIADISDIEESACTDPGVSPSRMERYHEAYAAALESDLQGYHIGSSNASTRTTAPQEKDQNLRSWRELTAVSWAAFSTNSCPSADEMFRLHALDMDCVTNRLKLAMYWLSDVRFEVEQTI